jgi:hypothetical protein
VNIRRKEEHQIIFISFHFQNFKQNPRETFDFIGKINVSTRNLVKDIFFLNGSDTLIKEKKKITLTKRFFGLFSSSKDLFLFSNIYLILEEKLFHQEFSSNYKQLSF